MDIAVAVAVAEMTVPIGVVTVAVAIVTVAGRFHCLFPEDKKRIWAGAQRKRADKDLQGHGAIAFRIADVPKVDPCSRFFRFPDLHAEQDGYLRRHHAEQVEMKLSAGQGEEFFVWAD